MTRLTRTPKIRGAGWTVIGEGNITSTLTSVKAYIIEDGSADYRIEVPSFPSLTCDNHTATITTTLGSANGNTFHLYMNPATTGTATFICNNWYTNGTSDSCSASYNVT